MIKRIKYVSRYAEGTTAEDIEAIAAQSADNNAKLGITGILLTGGGLFFQILEGPAEVVDGVYSKIAADRRNREVLLLGVQAEVPDRLFPDWAMARVDLDAQGNAHFETLREVLSATFEQRRQLDALTGLLERAVWQELKTRA
jgi:hypothetical protein